MIAKTEEELKNLRAAGRILAGVLEELVAQTVPGVTTAALDLSAGHLIRARGAQPAFLGYKPEDAPYPYPAVLCVSIDDEVVHGIPRDDRVVREGQLVMLDLGLSYRGFFADAAVTVCAGACDTRGRKLIDAAREALAAAVKAARAGGHVGDIGAAIARAGARHNLGVVTELGGHGLGRVPHEEPYIPNAGREGEGEVLQEGQIIAIEPIFTEGRGDIVLAPDGWTYKTADGSRSAEFEHTVLVTKNGGEILTSR
jgi:methionyl aminopeptidase